MVKTFLSSKWKLKSRHQLQFGLKVRRSKSKVYYLQFITFIADKTLCKLSLGPGEGGTAGSQWKKMVENPDSHSFSWHEIDFE